MFARLGLVVDGGRSGCVGGHRPASVAPLHQQSGRNARSVCGLKRLKRSFCPALPADLVDPVRVGDMTEHANAEISWRTTSNVCKVLAVGENEAPRDVTVVRPALIAGLGDSLTPSSGSQKQMFMKYPRGHGSRCATNRNASGSNRA